MKFILVLSLTLWWSTHTIRCESVTSKEFLDLNDADDNTFLWKNLFIKLNTLVSESERINQNLLEIYKRQEDHQNRITQLTKSVDALYIKEDIQDLRLTELMENIQKMHTDNKISQPWTTIQRRQDGSVNFYRNWQDYKTGFGNPNADFFIGLERLHQITTQQGPQELLIVLIDFEGETRYARYDLFRIGNETEKYAIMQLGAYTGDAGDGMAHHRGQPFSTYDRDNNKGKIRNCPENFHGAWWFYEACYSGHLNGVYREANNSKKFGVSWHPWRGWNVSMKYAAMLIRPRVVS